MDVFILLLAIGFGPSGLGGDRTWTRAELVRHGFGEVAGVVALVLATAAVVVGVSGPASRSRAHVVARLVVAQACAVVVLVASTMG